MEDNAIFASEVTRAVTVPETEYGLSQAVQERAQVLGKWLWIYFWTQIISMIPGAIVALMTAAELSTKGIEAVSWGFSGLLVVYLFQMGKVQDRLRTCAILNVVALALTLLGEIVPNESLNGIITLVSGIVGLVAMYQFMHGCADALVGVDHEQAEKWRNLWRWYIGILIALLVCAPLMLLLAAVSQSGLIIIILSIAVIGLAVAAIVQAIREIVYTYRTAKIFRGIASNL